MKRQTKLATFKAIKAARAALVLAEARLLDDGADADAIVEALDDAGNALWDATCAVQDGDAAEAQEEARLEAEQHAADLARR